MCVKCFFRYAGPVVLYTLYGLFDAVWQTYCYWIMGALTNETAMAARMAGFYKAWQNAGAAVTITTSFATLPLLDFLKTQLPKCSPQVFINDAEISLELKHHFKNGLLFLKGVLIWCR